MNTELAREVLDDIRMHPENHNQSHYAHQTECGTTLCIAGNALVKRGHTVSFNTFRTGGQYCTFRDPEGNEVYPPLAAAELLGLSVGEADLLFFYRDELAVARLECMVKNAENGRPILEDLPSEEVLVGVLDTVERGCRVTL